MHFTVADKIFKLKMFLDEQGSWMTMFLSTVMSLFLFSNIYNLILLFGGESTRPYR